MAKILGLDIGTNSIGSGMVKLENYSGSILHLGTRFIPAGGEQYNNFLQGKPLTNSKGQTVSKCAERRNFRSQRRNIDRYKKRRDNLLLVFDQLGIKPVLLNYIIDNNSTYPRVSVLPRKKDNKDKPKGVYAIDNTEIYRLFELRHRGVNGQLTLNELGRVLYSLNVKRGYQDIGLLDVEEENDIAIKRLKENQHIAKLKIINAVFTNTFKSKKPVYEFTAIENDLDQVNGKTSVPYFDKYIGKELEFLIETNKDGDNELKLFKKTEWKKSREENNSSLGNKTIGEKIFGEILEVKENLEKRHWKDLKIRNRVYDRKYYKDEFDRIWDKQSEYHDILNNTPKTLLQKIAAILAPGKADKQNNIVEKGLRYILKEYIVFYQRTLKKGQKKLITKCTFEKDEKRTASNGKPFTIIHRGIPKSHPLFQEFRIWQTINNLIIKDKLGDTLSLDDNQYKVIYEVLDNKEEAEPADILKKLDLSKEEYFINYREGAKVTGNKTLALIRKAFVKEDKPKLALIISDAELYEKLWHILYSINAKDNNTKIKMLMSDVFNLTEDTAAKLSKVKLEPKYASLSRKAITKLLPLMKRGEYFNEGEILPKIKEKMGIILSGDSLEFLNPRLKDKLSLFRSVLDFHGLRYDEAAEIVYKKHTRDSITVQYEKPTDIKFIKQHSLRHPIVEKVINECLKTVKAIWEDPALGKPDMIAVEMARELQNSQQQREKIYKGQNDNKALNDKAREALRSDKFNISNPTIGQIEKYRLWEEQKYHCPYTNDYISPEDLFATRSNGDYKYDVDHIIPRTRLKDDSFANKILCRRDANLKKGNSLARAFMETKRDLDGLQSFDDYCSYAKELPFNKKNRLLMKDEDIPDDFVMRQLKETQYITRRVIDELAKIVGSENIIFTSGGVTNALRHEWGIDDIFKKELLPRYKK
jgi:CRISPR-associated endonuclease Csn1